MITKYTQVWSHILKSSISITSCFSTCKMRTTHCHQSQSAVKYAIILCRWEKKLKDAYYVPDHQLQDIFLFPDMVISEYKINLVFPSYLYVILNMSIVSNLNIVSKVRYSIYINIEARKRCLIPELFLTFETIFQWGSFIVPSLLDSSDTLEYS